IVVPSRRAVTKPAERSTPRCWLMLGTWQPTSRESSLTERSPVASVSSTHRRLGSDSARATMAVRWRSSSLLCVPAGTSVALVIAPVILSLLAQRRKLCHRRKYCFADVVRWDNVYPDPARSTETATCHPAPSPATF